MHEFIDDDRGFLRWKDTHGNGYVLNTTRKPRADYLMLHRAGRRHLTSPNPARLWTSKYIKICSTEIGDLERWAAQHVVEQPRLTPCGSCRP